MNEETLIGNWALWMAAVPVAFAAAAVALLLFKKSSRGQLRQVAARHRQALAALKTATRVVEKAKRRLAGLEARSVKVRPRVLQEARDALQDAGALQKIADDRVQVSANHLRRVIYEEFPPSAHERLRKRHLKQDVRDNRPFTF